MWNMCAFEAASWCPSPTYTSGIIRIFKRSVSRVKHNHSLVPIGSENRFQDYINVLMGQDTSPEMFDETVASIYYDFPYLTKWMDWYLDMNRAPLIFPARANGELLGFGNDTNGQEGTGKHIKYTCFKKDKHPTMNEAIDCLVRVGNTVEMDYRCALTGMPLRHRETGDPKSRKRKREEERKEGTGKQKKLSTKRSRYINDGMPPTKTKELIGTSGKRQNSFGRPKGARGNAPTLTPAMFDKFGERIGM